MDQGHRTDHQHTRTAVGLVAAAIALLLTALVVAVLAVAAIGSGRELVRLVTTATVAHVKAPGVLSDRGSLWREDRSDGSRPARRAGGRR